jgi:hypothetical protein
MDGGTSNESGHPPRSRATSRRSPSRLVSGFVWALRLALGHVQLSERSVHFERSIAVFEPAGS